VVIDQGAAGPRGALARRLADQASKGIAPPARKTRLADYTFAYHDRVEIGRVALELRGKKTGLRPEDL
jgi:hypothetical protein